MEPTTLPLDAKSQPQYVARCYHCGSSFNALSSDWCSCLIRERTFVCPSCRRCFCTADVAYKRNFWMYAPEGLWSWKQRIAREQTLPPNPAPEEVVRPLVLVVDDDPQILAVAVRLVSGWGFGCVHASNGADALALARIYSPNVIVADALMPKMDGRELCRLVKSDPALTGVKVVIMSSVYTSGRFRREAISQFKADEYVAKPIQAKVLYGLVVSARDEMSTRTTAREFADEPIAEEPISEVVRTETADVMISETWPPQPLLTIVGDDEPRPAVGMTVASEFEVTFNATPKILSIEEELRACLTSAELLDSEGAAEEQEIEIESRPRACEGSQPTEFTPAELIQMYAVGVDPQLIVFARSAPGFTPATLVALTAAKIPLDFLRRFRPGALQRLTVSNLVTLFCCGRDPEPADALLQLGFDAQDILALLSFGVTASYAQEVIDAVGGPLSATEIMRLHAAGVAASYIRALCEAGCGERTPAEWISLSATAVPAEFIAVARSAMPQHCSTTDLLRLWLSGVDADVLHQLPAMQTRPSEVT